MAQRVKYCFNTTFSFFSFIYVFLSINIDLAAQESVTLGAQENLVLRANQLDYFVDRVGVADHAAVISGEYDSFFKEVSQDIYYKPPVNVNYWVRFKLKNTDPEKRWIVEFLDPHISKLIFFRPNSSGKYDTLKMVGYDLPFKNKEFQHKNYVFKTFLPKDSVYTFYALLNSKNYSSLALTVREESFSSFYALREYIMLGLFYGILLIMAIYNLFIFFNIRERVYLFYVLYTIGCAFNSFSEDGLGFQYLWPDSPALNQFIMLTAPLFLLSAFMLYSFSFLKIGIHAKKISYLIILFYVIYVIVFFIERLVSKTQNYYPFLYLIPFILIYITSYFIYFKGEKFARFFILGYTMILISFFIFVLRTLDLVPVTLFTVYSFNFGFLVEVVILSLALGDRIRIERHERELFQQRSIIQLTENEQLKTALIEELKEKEHILETVNNELESKVAARTLDLQNKTDELSVFNSNLSKLVEDLNQMNIKLDVDNWQLKKQVQEEVKARLSDEELSTEKFKELFPDEATCLRYLENIKWHDGFICKKCGHDRFITHTSPFTRKCTSCKHVESVTAETLFHGIRIPMDKAFYIVYDTIRLGKSKTLEELSDLLGLNKNTVWAFRKKIQAAYEQLKTKSKGATVKWDDLLGR
jgi:two-component system, sensor histidine kinase LadS